MIYKSAEHAVGASLFILSTDIGVGNPTGMVIDAMRRLFDASYLRKEASGLTQHDWHANAQFVVNRAVRALGKHSLGWSSILVRCGDRFNDDVKMAAAILADGISSTLPPHVTEALVWNVQTNRPTLREIEDKYSVSKSVLGRARAAINKRIHEIESPAWMILNDDYKAD